MLLLSGSELHNIESHRHHRSGHRKGHRSLRLASRGRRRPRRQELHTRPCQRKAQAQVALPQQQDLCRLGHKAYLLQGKQLAALPQACSLVLWVNSQRWECSSVARVRA
jgi:hypothetical protein